MTRGSEVPVSLGEVSLNFVQVGHGCSYYEYSWRSREKYTKHKILLVLSAKNGGKEGD